MADCNECNDPNCNDPDCGISYGQLQQEVYDLRKELWEVGNMAAVALSQFENKPELIKNTLKTIAKLRIQYA